MIEIIVEKNRNDNYVKVEKISPGFPDYSYYRVTTQYGVALDDGSAEAALREVVKYMT